MLILPGSKVGISRSSGSLWASIRSRRSAPSGLASCQAANFLSQASRRPLPRSAKAERTFWTISTSMAKGVSSKPSFSLRALTPSVPIFAPCTWARPASTGIGQPMTVVRRMKDGLSVTAFALSMASMRASTFSS